METYIGETKALITVAFMILMVLSITTYIQKRQEVSQKSTYTEEFSPDTIQFETEVDTAFLKLHNSNIIEL